MIVTLARRILPLSIITAMALPAHAALTANDDARQVPQDTPVVIDVLNNDASDQGTLVITGFSNPANGTIEDLGTSLRYIPKAGFYGADRFTYTVDNGVDAPQTALVSITVTPNEVVVEGVSIVEAAPRAARNVMRSHREAVSQFLDSGSFASVNSHEVAHWQQPLGGSAGDSDFAFGGAFVSVNHRTGEQDAGDITAGDAQAGYDESMSGLTIGADFSWRDHWIAGAAIGASNTDIEYLTGAGDFSMKDASVLGFASYRGKALTVQAQLGYSALNYDFEYADSKGNNRFAFTKAQYAFRKQGWQIIPALQLNYQNQYVEAYIESASSQNPSPSSYSSQKTRAFNGGLSLHVDKAMNFNWGVFLPRFMLTYEFELNSGVRGVNGYQAGEAFEIATSEDDSGQGQVNLGASFVLPRGLAFYTNLQTLFGIEGYSSNTFQLGVRKEF